MTADSSRHRFATLEVPSLVAVAVAAAAWYGLSGWQPTTTWHLAPALVGGAGAWVAGVSESDTVRGARLAIGVFSLAGFLTAWGEAMVLQHHGLLAGPSLFGTSAVTESLAVALAGSTSGLIAGLRRGAP